MERKLIERLKDYFFAIRLKKSRDYNTQFNRAMFPRDDITSLFDTFGGRVRFSLSSTVPNLLGIFAAGATIMTRDPVYMLVCGAGEGMRYGAKISLERIDEKETSSRRCYVNSQAKLQKADRMLT